MIIDCSRIDPDQQDKILENSNPIARLVLENYLLGYTIIVLHYSYTNQKLLNQIVY